MLPKRDSIFSFSLFRILASFFRFPTEILPNSPLLFYSTGVISYSFFFKRLILLPKDFIPVFS